MKITLAGFDIAKTVFHFYGVNQTGKLIKKKVIKRGSVIGFFSQLEPCTVVMEACGSANYWYRKLSQLGHEVKLIAPQYVVAYRRKNKNDFNDAEAIAEAAQRANMCFVTAKTLEQQDMQILLRIRDRNVSQRTKLLNQIRGMAMEYGVTFSPGKSALKAQLSDYIEQADNDLTVTARAVFYELYEELLVLEERIIRYEKKIAQLTKDNPICIRLQSIIGIGKITSAALFAAANDGKQFQNGRHLSAWCGLEPRQCSSGGKNVLLGISKRGNKYLRCLLVHCARAVLQHCKNKTDRLSIWAESLKARSNYNKACVALANKLARIAWVVMAKKQEYQAA